mmetsp:Transcript_18351/g.46939  ORF Transcript_18351/g.46939 Transcript_18351/m.46939 type:complete len:275 (-) Transcript_18351:738-1562(-)
MMSTVWRSHGCCLMSRTRTAVAACTLSRRPVFLAAGLLPDATTARSLKGRQPVDLPSAPASSIARLSMAMSSSLSPGWTLRRADGAISTSVDMAPFALDECTPQSTHSGKWCCSSPKVMPMSVVSTFSKKKLFPSKEINSISASPTVGSSEVNPITLSTACADCTASTSRSVCWLSSLSTRLPSPVRTSAMIVPVTWSSRSSDCSESSVSSTCASAIRGSSASDRQTTKRAVLIERRVRSSSSALSPSHTRMRTPRGLGGLRRRKVSSTVRSIS